MKCKKLYSFLMLGVLTSSLCSMELDNEIQKMELPKRATFPLPADEDVKEKF